MSEDSDLVSLRKEPMCGPPPEGYRDEDYQVPTANVISFSMAEDAEAQAEWQKSADEDMVRLKKVDEFFESMKATATHYQTGGVEPWDLIHDAQLNFDEGNVVKYVCRHRKKDGLEDLKKAMAYLKALALQTYGCAL